MTKGLRGYSVRDLGKYGDAGRCESRHTLTRTYGPPYQRGTTLRCQRPAGRHRLHQYGGVQWERGDK